MSELRSASEHVEHSIDTYSVNHPLGIRIYQLMRKDCNSTLFQKTRMSTTQLFSDFS